MLGVTNDQNYNDIADALREVGADLSEETFTPSEMAPAIRGLRSRWGNIEGDIANQTDLQNALNSKADSADLGTMSEEDDAPSDNKQYGRKNGDWVPITDELANWGQIAGDLSDQTDLQEALDAKADAADLGMMSEEDDAPSDNKQYGRKNGDWVPITDELANWGQIAGNLSDQTDLKNVLDEKLEAHDTELSGSIVTFEAENDHSIKGVTVNIDPVQDLHGYSNPWPAGGGKNLLGVTAVTTTANGLTFTINADGSVKVNGTATAAGTFPLCGYRTLAAYGMVANQTYILSGTPSGLGDNCYLMFAVEGTASPEYRDKGSGAEFQPSDLTIEYRAIIVYTYGTTLSNVVFQPMIRKSTEDASWAPYENICPITGWDEAVVTRTGKNLFDKSILTTNSSWQIVPLNIPSGVYTMSTDKPTSDTSKLFLYFRLTGSSTLSSANAVYLNHSVTLTIPDGNTAEVVFRRSEGTDEFSNYNYQLELSSTASAYEPYQGTSVTIDLDGTRYSGTLNVLTGEMTVDRVFADLTGTALSGWSKSTSYPGGVYKNLSIISTQLGLPSLKSSIPFICSHAKTAETLSEYLFGTCFCDNSCNIRIMQPDNTEADWRAYVITQSNNGTPVQCCFWLAEPFTVQLTPEQLSSVIGTNHLWADTGDSTVTLRLHTGDLAYQDTVDYETQITNKPDFGSMLSGSETSMVATKNYAKDSLIAVGDDLYKATSAIASGSNIVVGSNVTATTIETELALKANSSSVYTKTQTDTLLNAKANASSVYTKTETDELFDEKLDKDSDTELSGDIVTFDAPVANAIKALSVSIDPVQDLHGYDNPWPAGGGVNKFDGESETGRINTSTGADNSVTPGVKSKNFISVQPSTSYRIVNPNTVYIIEYDENKEYIRYASYYSDQDIYTTGNTAKFIRFYVINGDLTTLSINYPSTITTYYPVSNICPISGHTSAVVTKTGKNLYDKNNCEFGKWINSSGNIQTNQPSACIASNYVKVLPSSPYTVNSDNTAQLYTVIIAWYDEYENFLSREIFYYNNLPRTVTSPVKAYKARIGCSIQSGTLTQTILDSLHVQVEQSSDATPYEAPQIQQVTIDLDGTRYGGVLDVLAGVLTVDKAMVDLGTLIFVTQWNDDNILRVVRAYLPYKGKNNSDNYKTGVNAICEASKWYPYDASYNGLPSIWNIRKNDNYPYGFSVVTFDSGSIFYIKDINCTTASEYTNKYNGVQLVYELATPLTVQLTPEQLSTLIGTNHLWADTGNVTLTLRTGAGKMAYQDVVDYDELTNKPDLNDKATVITETKSGNIVSISNGAEAPVSGLSVSIEPVQDLHGYDNPWPAGGGANIWDEQWELGTFQGGELKPSTTRIRNLNPIKVTPETTYRLVAPIDTFVMSIDTATDWTQYSSGLVTTGNTFTTPSWANYIYISPNTGYGTTYNHDIAINYPSTVTTYQPYSNICPISGHTSATVTRTGKNLFDKDNFTAWNNVYPDSTTGEMKLGPANLGAVIPIKEGTYTISFPALNVTMRPAVFDHFPAIGDIATAVVVINTTTLHGTITAPAGSKYLFIQYNNTAVTQTYTTQQILDGLQLELSSTESSYEPYQGTSVTIDLDGTRYGAMYDALTGEMTVTKAIVDLGTISFVRNSGTTQFYSPSGIIDGISNQFGETVICSAYESGRAYNDDDMKICYYGTRLWITDSRFTSQTEFNNSLSGVYCVYELATPLTVQLTPSQLSTLLGTNNIWADTGDTEVTYRADSKMYIDQKVNEAVRKTKQVIAAVTDTMVAPSNLTAGDFIIVGDDLIKATSNVASGATLTIGSNCVKTTVAEALIALASA